MNEEGMLKPALIGGVLLGVLSSIPVVSLFNCVCCAWVIGGGMLAAYLYVKNSSIPVTLGRGVALGLLTGIIGTVVSGLFMIPMLLLMKRGGIGIMEQVRRALEQIPNLPPEATEALRGIPEKGGMDVFFFVMSLFFMLVSYCLIAMLGGAIGVAIFEKRKPGAPPLNMPPPEAPIILPPPPPPDA
jgi:hypothetical protein